MDKDARRKWMADDPLRNPLRFTSCHWGQLKLLYGEIEFLTMAAHTHNLAECTLVYAGAAPGHSIALLRRMFPDIMFLLVDPAHFVAKADSHVRILNTLFTDELVHQIATDQVNAGRTLLFLSDIRLTVDDTNEFEDAVFADMLAQQKWCVHLNAAMSMLKFRLPFSDSKTGARDMRYDYKQQLKPRITLRPGVPKDPATVFPGAMVYLDGEIRLQVYPPSDSAETRLIVRRTAAGKYMMRSYDYLAYEETMAYFNTVTRQSTFTFSNNSLLSQHIAGFEPDTYECASEAWIVSEYVRVVLKQKIAADFARTVVRVVFTIHQAMWEYTKRSIISCKIGTPLAGGKHKGMGKIVARLINQHGMDRVRITFNTLARSSIARAEAQIIEFTNQASRVQLETFILRRVDYLAQINWLRSEIAVIGGLLKVYVGMTHKQRHG